MTDHHFMIVNQLITNPFEIQFNSGRSRRSLVWQRGKGGVRERKKVEWEMATNKLPKLIIKKGILIQQFFCGIYLSSKNKLII